MTAVCGTDDNETTFRLTTFFDEHIATIADIIMTVLEAMIACGVDTIFVLYPVAMVCH
jgi:hypothetical protein